MHTYAYTHIEMKGGRGSVAAERDACLRVCTHESKGETQTDEKKPLKTLQLRERGSGRESKRQEPFQMTLKLTVQMTIQGPFK